MIAKVQLPENRMMHTNECAVGIPTRQDKSELIVPQRNSFVNTGTLQDQRLRLYCWSSTCRIWKNGLNLVSYSCRVEY